MTLSINLKLLRILFSDLWPDWITWLFLQITLVDHLC